MPQYRLYGLTVSSDIELPELQRSSSRRPACAISLTTRFEAPREWFRTWHANGRRWLCFGRRDGGYLLRFPGMADFDVAARGDRIKYRPDAGLPAETFRHLLLDQVVPLAIGQAGRLALHASAVHVPRVGAIAFAGLRGRGKSTLAATLVAGGCPALTDDCVVVASEGGQPMVAPSYPGFRLWTDSARLTHGQFTMSGRVAHYSGKRRMVPPTHLLRVRQSGLRALFVLARRHHAGSPARIHRMTPRAAVVALTRCAYVMDPHDRQELRRLFDSVAALVATVPVFELSVTDDRRRLDAAADTVLSATG